MAPVKDTGPNEKGLTAKRFEMIKQTVKSVEKSRNRTLTCDVFFFISCFVKGG